MVYHSRVHGVVSIDADHQKTRWTSNWNAYPLSPICNPPNPINASSTFAWLVFVVIQFVNLDRQVYFPPESIPKSLPTRNMLVCSLPHTKTRKTHYLWSLLTTLLGARYLGVLILDIAPWIATLQHLFWQVCNDIMTQGDRDSRGFWEVDPAVCREAKKVHDDVSCGEHPHTRVNLLGRGTSRTNQPFQNGLPTGHGRFQIRDQQGFLLWNFRQCSASQRERQAAFNDGSVILAATGH